jgi:hypothetical protein
VVAALLRVLAAADGLGTCTGLPAATGPQLAQLLWHLSPPGRRGRFSRRDATPCFVAALQGWPTDQQLLALMRTRPGEAVAYQVCTNCHMRSSAHAECSSWADEHHSHQLTAVVQDCPATPAMRGIDQCPQLRLSLQDIEEDPSRLLSTGLFKSCRPVVFPPKRAGEFYPTFLRVTLSQQLQPVVD